RRRRVGLLARVPDPTPRVTPVAFACRRTMRTVGNSTRGAVRRTRTGWDFVTAEPSVAAEPSTEAPHDVQRRLQEVRARAGLTQAQLAALLGVSIRSVIRWERGQARPLAGVRERLGRMEAAAPASRAAPPALPLPSAPRAPLDRFVGRERELETVTR